MAHEHSNPTDQLNSSQATVILNYAGLALLYFTPRGELKAQILRRPDHKFSFEVIKVQAGGSAHMELDGVDPEKGLHLEVTNPVKSGFQRFEKGVFRVGGTENDKNDFRWIVDMEGSKLHGNNLKKLRPTGGSTEIRLQELSISDGTVYTSEISTESYGRETLGDPSASGVLIGQIAKVMSVTIECRDDDRSGIRISNPKSKDELWLPKQPNVQYLVNVKNTCDFDATGGDGPSDFVLYYDVVRDTGEVRYDLKKVCKRTDPEARAPIVDFDDLALDGNLVMCDGVYLRRTSGWQ